MIELPDEYGIHALSHGYHQVCQYFNACAGHADRYLLAKSIVEGRSKEELVQYIAQMLLGDRKSVV